MYLPGIPVHVVHRGHYRDACFFVDEDCRYCQHLLAEGMKRYGAELHAYCLMTNHVHLLFTPYRPDSLSRLMQHVVSLYVRCINRTYRRSGTLWEGRYKGSLVDAENYLLSCYRYIELNLVTEHPIYSRLPCDVEARRTAYHDLFRISLPDQDREAIAECLSAS